MPDQSPSLVPIMLNGGRVTNGFRAALFAAAARQGVSINEFVLMAAAEKLRSAGARFEGVFDASDRAGADQPIRAAG